MIVPSSLPSHLLVNQTLLINLSSSFAKKKNSFKELEDNVENSDSSRYEEISCLREQLNYTCQLD